MEHNTHTQTGGGGGQGGGGGFGYLGSCGHSNPILVLWFESGILQLGSIPSRLDSRPVRGVGGGGWWWAGCDCRPGGGLLPSGCGLTRDSCRGAERRACVSVLREQQGPARA